METNHQCPRYETFLTNRDFLIVLCEHSSGYFARVRSQWMVEITTVEQPYPLFFFGVFSPFPLFSAKMKVFIALAVLATAVSMADYTFVLPPSPLRFPIELIHAKRSHPKPHLEKK